MVMPNVVVPIGPDRSVPIDGSIFEQDLLMPRVNIQQCLHLVQWHEFALNLQAAEMQALAYTMSFAM